MDSDLEQRLNRGLKVEQRGLEEGGWRIGLGDKLCCAPHPSPTLYRWPRGPWGAAQGELGVQPGLPSLPNLTTPSHRKPAIMGFGIPTWRRFPSPWCAPTPLAGQGSLGGLPPKARGAGEWVVLPGTFRNLP